MEAQDQAVEEAAPLSAVVKLERIREALQSWRDGWVEPAFSEDFSDDDVDAVMDALEEIEGIVDAPDAEPHGTPVGPVPPETAAEARDDRVFQDRLWQEREETRIIREVDRRPGPDGLILTLALMQYGDDYGSARWIRWLAGYLKARGCFDHDVGTDDQWRARVRAAAGRDMLSSNGRVVDGEFSGDVKWKLTERGRIELASWEEDHPKVVREPS